MLPVGDADCAGECFIFSPPRLLSAAIIDAAVLMEWGECPWSVCPLSVTLLCWRGRGRVAGLALRPQL